VNTGVRVGLFIAAAAGVAVMFAAGLRGLPPFGHYRGPYGDAVVVRTESLRRATNSVTTVVMDIRAVDTIGEEFILLAAAVGALMLLRKHERGRSRRRDGVSGVVRAVGAAMAPPVALLGLYVVGHGQITPGGGFQGGVVLATPSLLVFLALRRRTFEGLHRSQPWELAQAMAVSAFVGIGFAGLIAGTAFLDNVIPLGTSPGTVFTAGTIDALNAVAGVAVSTAIVLVSIKLLEQLDEVSTK
jgi:multicomponent Na+:H+ antiporter subunit B